MIEGLARQQGRLTGSHQVADRVMVCIRASGFVNHVDVMHQFKGGNGAFQCPT